MPALYYSSMAKRFLSNLAHIWSKLTKWAPSLKQERLSGITAPDTDPNAQQTMSADTLRSHAQIANEGGDANIDSMCHNHEQPSRSRRAPMLRRWLDEDNGRKNEKVRDHPYYVAKMKDYLHGWDTAWDKLARSKDARKKA